MPEAQKANDELERVAGLLVEDIAGQGLQLNYDLESLAAVDQILAGYGIGRADENTGLVELVGAYFGEVLRRNFGGDWYENVPPDGATGLNIEEASEFWVWCHTIVYKQLQNGDKSLFAMYDVVRQRLQLVRHGS